MRSQDLFLSFLAFSAFAQGLPDLTACNGQVVCAPVTALSTSTPFAISFAQNFFASPLTITLFTGFITSDMQANCRGVSNQVVQSWPVSAAQILSSQGLGYTMLNLSQQSTAGTQPVFVRVSSDGNTVPGNCFIGTTPLSLTQAQIVIQPTPTAAPQTVDSTAVVALPLPTTITIITSPISDKLTITIACSAAAAIIIVLTFIFTILFMRKRRLHRKNFLDESLEKHRDSSQPSETTLAPLLAVTLTPTPPLNTADTSLTHLNTSYYSTADPSVAHLGDALRRSNTLARSATQIHITDAHAIANAFKKELADPQKTIGDWDQSSAETDSIKVDAMGRRVTEKSQGSFGLDRIL